MDVSDRTGAINTGDIKCFACIYAFIRFYACLVCNCNASLPMEQRSISVMLLTVWHCYENVNVMLSFN